MTKTEFVDKIAPVVVEKCKAYGIKYPSAVIAHACNESKYGMSGLAKYNNLFGMKKSSSWKGKTVKFKTKEEYKKGKLTEIYAEFKVFDSYFESIEDYLKLVTGSYYTGKCHLKDSTSYSDYLYRLMPVYCTSTTQANKCCTIIKDLKLTKFDEAGIEAAFEKIEYYPAYDGYSISIAAALRAIGADFSYSNRKKIAVANGIIGYKGTAGQNLKMLELLKKGKLIKV